jgi:hypothetical protein
MQFTRHEVLKWMRENRQSFTYPNSSELNFKAISEAALIAFKQDPIDGPLTDNWHWIWECPFDV